jgi:hypothetical protein
MSSKYLETLNIGVISQGLNITIYFENGNFVTTTIKVLLEVLAEKELKIFKQHGHEKFEKSVKDILLLGRNGICNQSVVDCFEQLKDMRTEILSYLLQDKASVWSLNTGKITKFVFNYDRKDYEYKIKEIK